LEKRGELNSKPERKKGVKGVPAKKEGKVMSSTFFYQLGKGETFPSFPRGGERKLSKRK